MPEPRVAVLIPCYNEEQTIAKVVADFRASLPGADIWVFDNNSSDATALRAVEAGARVVPEPRQGKGNVVRSMFRQVDADAYVLVDGDDTYPAEAAQGLLAPVLAGEADLVVGDRLSSRAYDEQNRRPMHGFGNRLVRWLINRLFGSRLGDIMSGYRAMSRAFVKTMPVLSTGFEIETEMTLHALDRRWRLQEVPIAYRDRPEGSESKLSTLTDGMRVLRLIALVFKDYKPMRFFAICAAVLCVLGLLVGLPPVLEYVRFQYVYKVPSAVLAAALEIMAMLLFVAGLILETTVKHYREQYELYLNDYFAGRLRAARAPDGGQEPGA
jgi:glycosyltransferase involved in cell wall biosynthesis